MPAFECVFGRDVDSRLEERDSHEGSAPEKGSDPGTHRRSTTQREVRCGEPTGSYGWRNRGNREQLAPPGHRKARPPTADYGRSARRHGGKRGMDGRCELGDRGAMAPGA